MRNAASIAVLSLFVGLAVAPANAAAPVATLGVGDQAFWEGTVRPVDQNGYRRYPLEIAEQGEQLRIALDRRSGSPGLQIEDPVGNVTRLPQGWYGVEAFFDEPALGTWTVIASSSFDGVAPFRLRARLDGVSAPGPQPAEQRLPNLRMVPPFEFTFSPPPAGNGIVPTFGLTGTCTPQEIVETNARNCLRFSTGPANTGTGPLLVEFPPPEGVVTSGTAYQVVYDSNGHTSRRPAGTYEYHKTHMHYHHSGFGKLELLRVTDEQTGTLVPAGEGPKQGFCTGDVIMFDWFGFTQPRAPVDSSCVDEAATTGTNRPMGTTMALNTGWADLYSWVQDGMYVEWTGNTDGLYVVRVTADSKAWILESNETDNTSYALIRIAGDTIEVLERGLGSSPWDPAKELVADRLPAVP